MRNRCQIHPATGSLQLFEVDHESEEGVETATDTAAPGHAQSEVAPPQERADTDGTKGTPAEMSAEGESVETTAGPSVPLFELQAETLLSLGVPRDRSDLVQGNGNDA